MSGVSVQVSGYSVLTPEEHRTSNIERPTSNVEAAKVAKQTYDLEKRLPKRNTNSHSRFGIGCVKTNEIKMPSEAKSLFDVQRWMFDVGRSLFKTTLYDINATGEQL